MTLWNRALEWLQSRLGELARFGVVGATGVVVNLGVFNALWLGPLSAEATVAGDDDRVVTAKVAATVVSVVFAWWAHRGWTFRGRRRHRPVTELLAFAGVNVFAIAIEAGLVYVTHHGLGWTSLLANNLVSLVGIGLGTIARYIGFNALVFASADSASSTAKDSPLP